MNSVGVAMDYIIHVYTTTAPNLGSLYINAPAYIHTVGQSFEASSLRAGIKIKIFSLLLSLLFF